MHEKFCENWKVFMEETTPELKCHQGKVSRADDKPLAEPMMAYFTDAFMHHSASMS